MLSYLLIFSCVVASALSGPPLVHTDDPSVHTHLHRDQNLKNVQENPARAMPRYRLPVDFDPISYEIKIVPILPPHNTAYTDFDAPGDVIITVQCLNPVNQITLNSRKITVQNATVTGPDGAVTVDRIEEVPDEEFLILHLNQALTAGVKYTIYMQYMGEVSTSLFGLYRAEYTDEDGQQFWLATTQMETTGFRQMTPSFDEPTFKATFQLSIGYNATAGFNTLSNSVISRNSTDDNTGFLPPGFTWDIYNTTVPMSTYLVALVVSNFKCKEQDEAASQLKKLVGVCGPPHLMDKGGDGAGGAYSANASDHLLRAFEQEFDEIKYPEQKMHSVAVPRAYFEFGAMENLGLNIYRDNLLVEFGKRTLESARYSITSVLSHELAHQWFGDLVTTGFWTHIWLNEGFATYMAYVGVESILPGVYDDIATSLLDSNQVAMSFDVTSNSHPVINDPKDLGEISSLFYFDSISYRKGGALIRMMEHFLGRDNLFKGLHAYLRNKTFDNAFQDDLFAHLDDAAPDGALPTGLSVKDIMDTWTLQEGFPLVRVSRATNTSAYISQERYSVNRVTWDREFDPNDLWAVPVSVVTASDPDFAGHKPEPEMWIPKDVLLKSIPVDNTNQWFLVNPEGYGYYRVLYEPAILQLIQAQLNMNDSVISSAAKAKLLEDYVRFAEHGYAALETALDNMKFIGNDPHHLVWKVVLSFLSPLSTRLSGTTNATAELKAFLEPRVGSALDTHGWTEPEDEHGVYTILRPRLLDWACFVDHPKCGETATNYFNDWTVAGDSEKIPINLRAVVVCAGVSRGGEENFNKTLAEYNLHKDGKSEFDSTQATLLAAGLACTQDPAKQEWLLNNTLTLEVINEAQRSTVLNTMAGNSGAREALYEFLNSNWDQLAGEQAPDNYPGSSVLVSALNAVRNYQNTPADRTAHLDLRTAISTNEPALFTKIQTSLDAITTSINSNIEWASNQLPIYKNWFSSNA